MARHSGADKKSAADAFQEKLSVSLLGLFESVISNRRGYYTKHPERIPTKESVGAIIDSYSSKNAVISGGLNLIPGPWGLVGIVPELTLVFRNQLTLIYDIGIAYGKPEVLTKELLAGVLLDALGVGVGSLFVMQGSKLIVKRASLRVFQRLISMLAGKVTQQALKSALSKWVPVLGAAAMAAWVLYMTKKVGRRSVQILSQDITVDDKEDDDTSFQSQELSTDIGTSISDSVVAQRLRILVSLAAIDGAVHDKERGFIKEIISNCEITPEEESVILASLANCLPMEVDYDLVAENPCDSVAILVDMVALSKRDEVIHPAEKIYIRKVGETLNIAEEDISELIEKA